MSLNDKRVSLKTAVIILIILCIIIYTFYSTIFTLLVGKACNIGMAVEFNDHAAAAWIAMEKGWFEQENLNISTLATFKTGLELAAALSRGDIDVAWACLGPIIVAYSRGVKVSIVCMAHLHGYAIVGKPEFTTLNDLNGKVIACPGPGSPGWLLLKIIMEKYDLHAEVKKMAPYIALNALITGQIDAAALPEHYVTLAENSGMRVLIRSQDVWPEMPGSVLVVKSDYLDKHPEIVRKLVKVTLKALDYINSHFEDSAKIVAKRLGISYDAALRSMSNLDYTFKIDVSEVQMYIDLLAKYGAIEHSFNASEILCLDFISEVS